MQRIPLLVLNNLIKEGLVIFTLLFGLMLTSCIPHIFTVATSDGSGGGAPTSNITTFVIPAPASVTSYTTPQTINANVTLIGGLSAYSRGYKGQSVTIAFIGAGVRANHNAFGNRIVNATGVIGTSLTTNADGTGVGTRVAGIAAGKPGTNEHTGVAYEASVMPIDIVHGGTLGSLAVAVQYAITNNARIVNYDLASPFVASVTVSNNGGSYGWKVPMVDALLTAFDAGTGNALAMQASVYGNLLAPVDVVFVSDTGSNGFNNNITQLTVVSNQGDATVPLTTVLNGNSFGATPYTLESINTGNATVSINVLARDFFSDGINGVSGLLQSAPILDPRLQSKFLIVGAVTVGTTSTVIKTSSNGCGASKNWCLVAPVNEGEVPLNNGGVGNIGDSADNKLASGLVSGALAVLKSRLPDMPMAVIRAILLETADPLGTSTSGPDDIYGHGMLNLGKAITVQTTVSIDVASIGGVARLTTVTVARVLPAPAAATAYTTPQTINDNVTLIGGLSAYQRGYKGQSVTIAFIGAGVRANHTAFGSRIVNATGVIGTSLTTNADGSGVGTRVAGIAAGKPGTNEHTGVAYEASVMPIDIVHGGTLGSLAVAVQYAVANGARIVNYDLSSEFNATVKIASSSEYSWNVPMVDALLTAYDAGAGNTLAMQASVYGNLLAPVDVVFVSDTGSNDFNGNLTQVMATLFVLGIPNAVTFPVNNLLNGAGASPPFRLVSIQTANATVSMNVAIRDFFSDGLNGVSGLLQSAPILDPRLQSKFLIVGAVTVGTTSTVIKTSSNGCGASKNWCLVAPVHSDSVPANSGSTGLLETSNDNKLASGLVSGALAVLKSRLPDMPMAVIRGILLETADPLGTSTSGPDDIYGHGMLNLGKAITTQATVSVAVPTITISSQSSFLLSQSQIDLSPAMRGLTQQSGGISIAVGFLDDYYYDTPFSSILKGNPSRSNRLGFGLLAREDMSTKTKTLGGFGLRTNSKGNLLDFDVKHKRAQLSYALCTSCSGSVWDEYKLDNEPLPFFADTERKLSSGWKFNDQIGAFVVLGLDEDNSYDKYSQYGINWSGIELGNWEFAGSFSSIKEQQGYVLGSKFSGAYAIGESSSNQIGIRAQLYIEGWRVFGGVEYGKTKVDTLHYSSVQAIDDVQFAGWRLGLDKDSIFRSNDKLHFGFTKIPSVISGNMKLMLSQTTGDTAYAKDLAMDYLNKTEFRKHNIDLDGSDSFVYRLGYSTPIHKQQQLAIGLEHYIDDIEEDQTGFSVQYRFDL